MTVELGHDAWVFLGGLTVAVVTTVGSVLVAHVQTRNRVRDLDQKVTQVRTLAEPTGNGYADETRASLRRIEQQGIDNAAAIRDLTERHVRSNAWLTRHLADHAQNDIRNREER